MTDHCRFSYDFHPVGQGLFASGALFANPDFAARPITPQWSGCCFQWVYDCGTSSSQTQLRQRILELPLYGERRDRLGLVTISHFDNDHVSGIPTLLSNFAVDTLLLPYIPLWKRLLLAFKEGVGPGDEPMGFFVNPAAYLTAI